MGSNECSAVKTGSGEHVCVCVGGYLGSVCLYAWPRKASNDEGGKARFLVYIDSRGAQPILTKDRLFKLLTPRDQPGQS